MAKKPSCTTSLEMAPNPQRHPTTPEAAERAQLKPCPFCGGEARRFDISTADELDPNAGGSGIECVSCSASTALHFDRKENLEDSWNRRAALAAQEGGAVQWACERWRAEVANRPLVNTHRRALDTTWRQVVRHFGGDDVALLGPCHDDLVSAQEGTGNG